MNGKNMISTLTADCVWGAYLEEPCRRVIEIDERDSLYGLHLAIQAAVNFDNDHPFEFYAARTVRSRPRFSLGSEAVEMGLGGISSHLDRDMAWLAGFGFDKPPARHLAALQWAARLARMDDPPLCEIYPLPERLKLYYWFDFGDDWKFEIKKARHPKPPERRVKYPRVIEKGGPNPVQYPNLDE